MCDLRPIVVTGASRGSGLEPVRLLTARGQPVIGIARGEPDLWNLLVPFIRCDLSDRVAVRTLTQDLAQLRPRG
jgi:NAD(P)-dependent dehydrogenase (short-subunit alcohol dehydrogenase family)